MCIESKDDILWWYMYMFSTLNSVIVYLLTLKTLKPHPVGRHISVLEKNGNAAPESYSVTT